MMTTINRLLAALLLASACVAHAAGPLLTNDKPGNPQPMRWDTAHGAIPVYTDIGDYAYRLDGTVFLDNAHADRITAFALKQWSDVATSTWKAVTDPARFVKFSDVQGIGVDVIDGATAMRVYGHAEQKGLYMIYDQHGDVIEQVFGVPKDQVLGIAFAEFAEDRDGDGYPETITKATAVMNGWIVSTEPEDAESGVPPPDIDGRRIAGVFTHELGHAINLSHSQVNGQMAYFSYPGFGQDLYPGVPGCVPALYQWRYNDPAVTAMDPRYIETMFPFIDPNNLNAQGQSAGEEMSTVDRPDDIAALSDLYPTAAYTRTRGSITGTLFLKDAHTRYDGINVVARNVADPLGDAISAMSGDKTQGKIGPTGAFRINNLTPGAKYVVYIEEIYAGGYPTAPTALVSEAEYWNDKEQADASKDNACLASPITAKANSNKLALFYFNGYADGVQYYPVANGYLGSLSKDGSRAAGILDDTPFLWDAAKGVRAGPPTLSGTNASITRDGTRMIVQTNQNGVDLGIDPFTGRPLKSNSAGIWDTTTGNVTDLGSLNRNTCFGGSQIGYSSSYGWALSGDGKTAVGTAYVDRNKDGSCEGGFADDGSAGGGEIVPFIWTSWGSMRQLSLSGIDLTTEPWHRAHAVSGDGRVVVGTSNFSKAYAWINESRPIDLYKAIGALDGGYAMTPDASRVALETEHDGVVFWNANKGTGADAFTPTPALKWCVDLPFTDFGLSCEIDGAEWIQENFGNIPIYTSDISDDGKVLVARAGTFFESGFHGVLWVEGLGWIKLQDFFRTQGVVEAYRYGMDGPASINGAGNEIVGGIPGLPYTWYVDMKHVYVCRGGQSLQVDFPAGFIQQVRTGARMGRCDKQ